MGGVCSGVEGVRAEVRKRHAKGADLIKAMATSGFMAAGSRPSQAYFSPEEMMAVTNKARGLGMPVTTHATRTEGIARAAIAKFSSVEHYAWILSSGDTVFNNITVCPMVRLLLSTSYPSYGSNLFK